MDVSEQNNIADNGLRTEQTRVFENIFCHFYGGHLEFIPKLLYLVLKIHQYIQ